MNTPTNLDPAEIIFTDPSKLPSWQNEFCANYEYARQNEDLGGAVEEVRKRLSRDKDRAAALPTSTDSPAFNLLAWSPPLFVRKTFILRDFLAQCVPEFPATPWQSIEPERRRTILAFLGIREIDSGSKGIIDLGTAHKYCDDVQSGRRFGWLDDENSAFVLGIDFSEFNSFIVKNFKLWLVAKSRELTAADRPDADFYRERKVRKGQKENPRVWTNHLTELGKYRTDVHAVGGEKRLDSRFSKKAQNPYKHVKARAARFSLSNKIGFPLSWSADEARLPKAKRRKTAG